VTTSPSVSDPERWRKRAEKLRAIGADVAEPNLRARLVRIADGYDVLAERVERREQSAGDGRSQRNTWPDENEA
jgi:predicted secreted protein